MEGSYTSPPPTSPTYGDDLCWIVDTNVAMDIVTLIISLCGLVGNGVVFWLLGFHIRKNPITIYIVDLAVTDFIFLLFMVTFTISYMVQNVSCSALTSLLYLSVFDTVLRYSYNLGVYLLTAISIESCVSVLCPHWYRSHRSQRRSRVVSALLVILSVTVSLTVTFLCRSDDQKPCWTSLISMYAINLFPFALPMVISSTVLFIKVQCGPQQQQPRRLHVAVFLTVFFFLFNGVPLSIRNFLHLLSYPVVSCQIVLLLACINSSIKPFIYLVEGSCWRGCSLVTLQVSFQRVFEEPEENAACGNDAAMDTVVPAS